MVLDYDSYGSYDTSHLFEPLSDKPSESTSHNFPERSYDSEYDSSELDWASSADIDAETDIFEDDWDDVYADEFDDFVELPRPTYAQMTKIEVT